MTREGYSVRGARRLTQWAIGKLLEVMPDLSEAERRKLASTSPHEFRLTVGTQILAAGVAIEVVQCTLGHASLGTTSVYVSPEEARIRREAAKYHAPDARYLTDRLSRDRSHTLSAYANPSPEQIHRASHQSIRSVSPWYFAGDVGYRRQPVVPLGAHCAREYGDRRR
ncbi:MULTISPECIES: tyrosine-type recombinase/integrase [unclassified Burkholderia]|uniref:tyrosine-type recombinase/integrase n=1 Tax=unclassified Burkholderia TaxID=2613784 RepID=UPI00279623C1|nr:MULTISPECIES: tyrosine-type recombinase/integrase [unclassified Burkholderia]